ncbi:hypothetical protein VPH35_122846 [Triticum aestivum]
MVNHSFLWLHTLHTYIKGCACLSVYALYDYFVTLIHPFRYYISPAGIKIRSKKEVERYLEDNPDYAADLHLSQFSFKVPKPPNCPRQSELIEPTEVPPPVHEDPVHNYMPVPHGEANPVTHIPVTLALQVSVMLSKKRKLNQ